MKFKVGDKVKFVREKVYHMASIKIGEIFTIIETDNSDRPYKVKDREGGIVWFFAEEVELAFSKKPTREELLSMPDGTRITTDLDSKYNIFTKANDEFISDDGSCIDDYDINDDLTLDDDDYGTKIIKIEKPTEYVTVYEYATELQEMTIADIEKALGHPIKIVKEAE